ncbi:MAG: bifunctional adenosylcobinamide kinase/adenosylcobinamide-phosphate guanylyltransferase [Cyanophyceae cyanobacterium]
MNSKNTPSSQIILVTGAARSGKSEWAETLATQSGRAVVYVATALLDENDREWCERIDKHQRRRPSHWTTHSVPVALAEEIEYASASSCLLVDSLGSWVANLLSWDAEAWEETVARLLISLAQTQATVILVAEETGWGVVPAYSAGRQFRDRLGNLSRNIGASADCVYLVTGGHVLDLTQLGQRLAWPHE